MRFVDVYRRRNGNLNFVCSGCIQLGEPMVQRAPIVHSFTLADGSPVVYPAAKETATMTVELECTRRQAAQLGHVIHDAEIILTGLKFGADTDEVQTGTLYPESYGYDCIITGAVEIGERYAGSGIYNVTMPVQIAMDTAGMPDTVKVDTLRVTSVTLDGTAETVTLGERYVFQPKELFSGESTEGIFVRQGVWFTDAETVDFSYAVRDSDTDVYARVYLNGRQVRTSGGGSYRLEPGGTFAAALLPGANWIGLFCYGNGRPFQVKLCVYRQAVKG